MIDNIFVMMMIIIAGEWREIDGGFMGCFSATKKGEKIACSAGGYGKNALQTFQTAFTSASSSFSPTSEVEISIECEDLKKMDQATESDPIAVVYMRDLSNDLHEFVPIGRTEKVNNKKNAHFATKITLYYYMHSDQELKIEIYDGDEMDDYSMRTRGKQKYYDDEDEEDEIFITPSMRYMGETEPFKLGMLLQKTETPAGLIHRNNPGANGLGGIYISTVEIQDRDMITMHLHGIKLARKDMNGNSDPYFLIWRIEDGTNRRRLAYRSEVIAEKLSPEWHKFHIPARALRLNNNEGRIRIDVYDWDKITADDFIGSAEVTFDYLEKIGKEADEVRPLEDEAWTLEQNAYRISEQALQQPQEARRLEMEAEKQGKKALALRKEANRKYPRHKVYNKISIFKQGELQLRMFQVEHRPCSFVDFLGEGGELQFSVAIDFTASNINGDLHRTNGGYGTSDYKITIQAVGKIIEQYDKDKKFPAFGFGGFFGSANDMVEYNSARRRPTFILKHPEAGSLDQFDGDVDDECVGIEGILNAYQHALSVVQLDRPTDFAPIIRHMAKKATMIRNGHGNGYIVLLMITDGDITDFDETTEAIVEASRLPMSIIIVGVGTSDFKEMEMLDSDGKLLVGRITQSTAARDIVQFVRMRDHVNDIYVHVSGGDAALRAKEAVLAQDVLAEIPDQVELYVKYKTQFNTGGTNPFLSKRCLLPIDEETNGKKKMQRRKSKQNPQLEYGGGFEGASSSSH